VNENSIVLKITYGNISFLLMGDAGKEAERSLIQSGYDLHADVLKVGHHGSSASSSPKFLQAVSPNVSIIEVGAHNEYGYPAPKTIEALKKVGSAASRTYRTDLNGNIDVTTNGKSYSVAIQKDEA
jgi:competence protein ComEC